MNKRQKKKKEKKYLPIIADEANLLTMTPEERKKAHDDYKRFREKYAYRKKYRDLKTGETLRYFYPTGKKYTDALIKLSKVGNSANGENAQFVTVTQSIRTINDKTDIKDER